MLYLLILWWWRLLHVRIFGECSTIYLPPTLLFLFKVEISSRTLIPLLCQDQSTVAQRAEATVTKCCLTSCMWARFLINSHTMPGHHIVSPLWLRQVKDVCVFWCNLPTALLAEWLGSFTCHCGNKGVERTPNESQHTKLTLKKKILPPLLLWFELTTFWSQVRHSNQQAIPAPGFCEI